MITSVTNAVEHEQALARIDELMDAEAGTPEVEELSKLAEIVQAYEQVAFPIALATEEDMEEARKNP